MGIFQQTYRCNQKNHLMGIYDYETFEIKNIKDLKFFQKKYPLQKINLLHRYSSVVWQGPLYVKTLNDKLKKKNHNYIVELGDNVGLSLALIRLKIKVFAIDKTNMSNNFVKILSIAKNEKAKILFIKKLRIKEIIF